MANPTSNFGWQMPTSTDLVTDLPADFETFGQAVDTSLAELKGGTSGQVLSKASNTDMDFTWVTSDDANAIQNTIVDAKGDLIAASASDVPARLAVGNNGETLVADSSTSTGLRYTAGNPIPNPVLNSCQDVWQRGTSISIAASTSYISGFTSDRWQTGTGANQAITVSRQLVSDSTNLPFIQYCSRYQRNSGQTGTGTLILAQSFESANSVAYAGKTVTFSFYARAGANYSAASSALIYQVYTGTGTDQNIFSGAYTGAVAAIDTSATLTTTWQRFTATATFATNTNELAIQFLYVPVGTAGANDYYEVTGVQIDIGSVALPVRRNGATIQGELAACQRYYYRQTAFSAYGPMLQGFETGSTSANGYFNLPVTLRSTPSAVDYSTLFVNDQSGNITVTNITIGNSSQNLVNLSISAASGMVAGRPFQLLANNSTSAYLGVSAEL